MVSREGAAGDAFAEHHAVVDGGDGCGGGADVDDEGGGFAGGEAGGGVFVSGVRGWEWNGKGLGKGGVYADSTPLRASQKAGVPQFSMAISMGFSLPLPVFRGDSVMRSGFSSNGLSCVSIPSISSFISSVFSLSPLVIGSEGLVFVSREVMAYSHRFVAVSQSPTRPLSKKGFSISMLGKGLWIAFSP